MCGRFSLTADPVKLAKFMGTGGLPGGWTPDGNITPGRRIPLVRRSKNGAREGGLAQWGLVPAWSRTPPARPWINARIETAGERPSFRGLVDSHRCLIPADGFYEWKKSGKSRHPHRITVEGEELFAFAGLWDLWMSPLGPLESVTLLTTCANERIAPIHDRMPVILDEAGRERWLMSGEPFERSITVFQVPYPADRICITPLTHLGPASAGADRKPSSEQPELRLS